MVERVTPMRAAGLGAATTLLLGMLCTVVADADARIPLPGGEIVKTLTDGTVVTVRLVDESAVISPSLGATPAHRNAWVSGSARIEISGPGADFLTKVVPGYRVGCQVDIGGGGAGAGLSGAAYGDGTGGLAGTVGGGGGANLSFGPGHTASYFVLDTEFPDRYGNDSHKPVQYFTGDSGSVTWTDSTIGLGGCGGAAQARAFVLVKVDTETVSSRITLWGRPFSLG